MEKYFSSGEGPNVIHPEKPSAVGSRDSLNRNGRSEYQESKVLIDEEVDKILNHINSKLPPEVLSKLHVGATIKELLHNYFNQGFQNMFNRYVTTVEDEMAKKFRSLVDIEERKGLNRYTPKMIPKMLNDVGGMEKFNTGEVEKSLVNIYGHLQGHIQRGTYELEQETNSLLRQKQDVGAFIRGESSYSILKCAFKDNLIKPETVSDIHLSINVLDSELLMPIYHTQVTSELIIKNMISEAIFGLIDNEIDSINSALVEEAKDEMTNHQKIFSSINIVDKYFNTSDSSESSNKRYIAIGNKVVEAVKSVGQAVSQMDTDAFQISENIRRMIDNQNFKNRGFNAAVNSITAILDTSRMGYQYIENNKNSRILTVREYEDQEVVALPDEKYKIVMEYLDQDQLRENRLAYTQQCNDFEYELDKLWDISLDFYRRQKQEKGTVDYDDVVTQYKDKPQKQGFWSSIFGGSEIDEDVEDEKIWDEVTFIQPTESEVEKANTTFKGLTLKIRSKLAIIEERIKEIFDREYPVERLIIEERLNFLITSFDRFIQKYNPFHCQPGIVLQLDLTSIKRKNTTTKSISNVLNEFLHNVSKGFSDDAFADFNRRRSTDSTSDADDFTTFSEYSGGEQESESLAGVTDV